MTVSRVAVVGAGVAGLATAVELAARHTVTVIDRLPVAGGVLDYDAQPVRELQGRCTAAGVNWMLGTTAVRWQANRLLTAGPGGIKWLSADHLFYAGGSRPATQAELRITGPRLAGVMPATVAMHFAEAKVKLGYRVAIVGTGDWAHAAGEELAHQDCQITVVALEEGQTPAFRHEGLITGWAPVAVAGTGRVAALRLARAGHEYRLLCDAVILATSPRALRNVDGAIGDSSTEDVSFVQPIADRATQAWVQDEARRATRVHSDEQLEVVT